MNKLTIDQRLAVLENQIEQEKLAKTLIEQQKRVAINTQYDERVARYKQQIIDDALAQRRKPIHVIPQRGNTGFNYNPGKDNSFETRYRQLLDLEEMPTADFEVEAL
jgi:phage repressor protein C with HTH and peptisase S24 domain